MGGLPEIRARDDQSTGPVGVESGVSPSVSKNLGTTRPTAAQRRYLERGLDQPGGKLPLFDLDGQEIDHRTIKACVQHGWAEPWFPNPIKPDWVVCRVTDAGRDALGA
jgi:hypothetical protein